MTPRRTHLAALLGAALVVSLPLSRAAAAVVPREDALRSLAMPRPVAPRDDLIPLPEGARIVDLALCLDTSGSMSGLIDSAKEKLWSIVNELGRAEPTPVLRVALVTYGNDGHLPEDGWVKLDVPLTSDLDLVSEHLFALTTNGGTEYVGRSVAYATEQLQWSNHPATLRIVVVAGNESADQDPVRLTREVCGAAAARGFHVNAIYCGNPEDGIAPGWRDAAILGSGYFASIDQDHGTLAVATPFDPELARLNGLLNATYIPFGAAGAAGASNQLAQDSNARTMNEAALAERVAAKAGALYQCAWDLVDACANGQVKLEDVPESELPEPLRAMSVTARLAYVHAKQAERAAVQVQIEALQVQRQVHIAQVMADSSLDDRSAFDRVLRDAVRAQASAAGFVFPEAPVIGGAAASEPAPGAPAAVGQPFLGPVRGVQSLRSELPHAPEPPRPDDC